MIKFVICFVIRIIIQKRLIINNQILCIIDNSRAKSINVTVSLPFCDVIDTI